MKLVKKPYRISYLFTLYNSKVLIGGAIIKDESVETLALASLFNDISPIHNEINICKR